MDDNSEPGQRQGNEPLDATEAGLGSGQRHRMTVATEVWIITALLHREQPERQDFGTREILARARRERLCGALRPGFTVHVNQHCVANRPPNPARLRLLVETAPGRRRLFRTGDPYDPRRAKGRTRPDRAELPARFASLLEWYDAVYVGVVAESAADPILGLRGLGKEVWSNEPPDEYVRRLREPWS